MCEVGPGGKGHMRQTTLSFVKSGGPRTSDLARNSTADTRKEEYSKNEEQHFYRGRRPSSDTYRGAHSGRDCRRHKGWI